MARAISLTRWKFLPRFAMLKSPIQSPPPALLRSESHNEIAKTKGNLQIRLTIERMLLQTALVVTPAPRSWCPTRTGSRSCREEAEQARYPRDERTVLRLRIHKTMLRVRRNDLPLLQLLQERVDHIELRSHHNIRGGFIAAFDTQECRFLVSLALKRNKPGFPISPLSVHLLILKSTKVSLISHNISHLILHTALRHLACHFRTQ
jgi:hypothetical protein